ncbi:MAG: DinB family protein [Chitinophagales bacterium]
MKISTVELLQDLTAQTQDYLNQAKAFKSLPLETLNWKTDAESWSVLECMEHLNLYGDFYLPEITHRITQTPHKQSTSLFKSGWLGNYFANSIRPKTKLNKMKTFKDKTPALVGSQLGINTLDRFIDQQNTLLQLLKKAKTVDLNRTKTGVSINSWIKIRLGDTLRFVIYHHERHLLQANKVLALQKEFVA